jgi:hypothetical protein
MAGVVFGRGSSVEDDDVGGADSLEQLLHAHWLGSRAVPEMPVDQTLEVGQSPFGDLPNTGAKLEHGRLRKPVIDKQALFAAVDQRRLPEGLEMLRCIGERQAGFGGEGVDRPLSLREKLEHLNPMRTSDGFSNAGKLSVKGVFELPVLGCHVLH